jgi:hypothetical protein
MHKGRRWGDACRDEGAIKIATHQLVLHDSAQAMTAALTRRVRTSIMLSCRGNLLDVENRGSWRWIGSEGQAGLGWRVLDTRQVEHRVGCVVQVGKGMTKSTSYSSNCQRRPFICAELILRCGNVRCTYPFVHLLRIIDNNSKARIRKAGCVILAAMIRPGHGNLWEVFDGQQVVTKCLGNKRHKQLVEPKKQLGIE